MKLHREHTHTPETDIRLLCRSVSKLLSQYPMTMLQFSPEEIQQFVDTGRGVLLPDPENPYELAAFAKLYQWPGTTQEGRTLFELGSWVVPQKQQGKGYGEQVFRATIRLGHNIDQRSQIIGVTELSNQKSSAIMQNLGGHLLGPHHWPSNFRTLLQDGAAQIQVIDITHAV